MLELPERGVVGPNISTSPVGSSAPCTGTTGVEPPPGNVADHAPATEGSIACACWVPRVRRTACERFAPYTRREGQVVGCRRRYAAVAQRRRVLLAGPGASAALAARIGADLLPEAPMEAARRLSEEPRAPSREVTPT